MPLASLGAADRTAETGRLWTERIGCAKPPAQDQLCRTRCAIEGIEAVKDRQYCYFETVALLEPGEELPPELPAEPPLDELAEDELPDELPELELADEELDELGVDEVDVDSLFDSEPDFAEASAFASDFASLFDSDLASPFDSPAAALADTLASRLSLR